MPQCNYTRLSREGPRHEYLFKASQAIPLGNPGWDHCIICCSWSLGGTRMLAHQNSAAASITLWPGALHPRLRSWTPVWESCLYYKSGYVVGPKARAKRWIFLCPIPSSVKRGLNLLWGSLWELNKLLYMRHLASCLERSEPSTVVTSEI